MNSPSSFIQEPSQLQVLIQQVWKGAKESVFVINSPVMLMPLVFRSHLEKQDFDGDHCTNDREPHHEEVPLQIPGPKLVIAHPVLAFLAF